jgi:hypothetical protein
MYLSYKREVYAFWMAIKDVFELLSKDVRGDDFWVLTPQTFQSPILFQLGSERVGLIAAFLFEEICREISFRPEYLPLKRTGAHVAVCADEITIISLGTEHSVCLDVHAKSMSKIHRIRGEADPGSVLVDLNDKLLAKALMDSTIFEVRKSPLNIDENSFPDLQALPQLATLTGIKYNNELQSLKDQAIALALQSPFRDLVA